MTVVLTISVIAVLVTLKPDSTLNVEIEMLWLRNYIIVTSQKPIGQYA